ncbi:S-layer homology domain-containing protein [Paenibacillus sp. GCM10027627]|uniref:S-layer homology domain-containing protein n=1 Tax=unclassified Paenibacillus TaxID=185978 RepID=UPI0036266E11
MQLEKGLRFTAKPIRNLRIPIALVIAMLAMTFAAPQRFANAESYSDTKGHWAESYIQWAVQSGMVKGYADGTFQPNKFVSEAEFLAMLLRSYGIVKTSKTGSDWADPYYQYGDEKGWPLTFDNDKGSFRRGQAATLMTAAATATFYGENAAIKWLLDEGISKGKTSPTIEGFAANGTVTRAEALTFIYMLKQHTDKLPTTAVKTKENGLLGIAMGDHVDKLLYQLGKPDRIEPSDYEYSWYVYTDAKRSYASFAMFGVWQNKIVAQFSGSSKVWTHPGGIAIGQTLEEAKKRAAGATKPEQKDTYYTFTKDRITDTLFFDTQNKNKVVGILRQAEGLKKLDVKQLKDSHRNALELQLFDLVNAERAARGIKPLQWDKMAAAAARSHSKDMGSQNFFGHKNLDGETAFDRMRDEGIKFRLASENIAAGFANSMYAHYSLLNSTSGHRESILNDELTRLGTGVAFGGRYNIYYTQDFYTPL